MQMERQSRPGRHRRSASEEHDAWPVGSASVCGRGSPLQRHLHCLPAMASCATLSGYVAQERGRRILLDC